jgi:hypothetical protein
MAEVEADLVAAVAVGSVAVVAEAVRFVGAGVVRFGEAVEGVRFGEAVAAASEAAELFVEAEPFAEAAVDFGAAAVDFAADMVALVAGTVTDAATGVAIDSSLASATPPGIGRVMPTILTIMDTPPMVIRVTTDTIRTLTMDMAHTDPMPLILPHLL